MAGADLPLPIPARPPLEPAPRASRSSTLEMPPELAPDGAPAVAASRSFRPWVVAAALVELFLLAVLVDLTPWGSVHFRSLAHLVFLLMIGLVLSIGCLAMRPWALLGRLYLGWVAAVAFLLPVILGRPPAWMGDSPTAWASLGACVSVFGSLVARRALSLHDATLGTRPPEGSPEARTRRRIVWMRIVTGSALCWLVLGAGEATLGIFWLGEVVAAFGVGAFVCGVDLARPTSNRRLKVSDRSSGLLWVLLPLGVPLLAIRVVWLFLRRAP